MQVFMWQFLFLHTYNISKNRIKGGGGSKRNFGELFWGTPENPGDFPKIPKNKISDSSHNYSNCFRSFLFIFIDLLPIIRRMKII